MKHTVRNLTFSLLVALVGAPLCAVASPGDAVRLPLPKPMHIRGYYNVASIWSTLPINVCWNMSSADYNRTRAARHAIRAQIESTWVKNSAATFAGWRACGASIQNGFGIVSSDVRPHSTALGTNLNGNLSGMVLDFDYKNWGTAFCTSQVQYCDNIIAAHEFGHALGLAHEQNRPDNPQLATCPADAGASKDDVTVGAFDINSIMNYCNPNYNGGGNLSATDIATIQKMYGSPGDPGGDPFLLGFDDRRSGDCTLSKAKITVFPSGLATWNASVRTTSGNDVWLADVTFLDATGRTITPIANLRSPSMNNHLWHDWSQTFTFPPALFDAIKSARLASRC